MSLTHQIRTSTRNFEQLASGLDLSLINDQVQAQEALLAAREMSGALVKAEDELREEILRRERVRF